MEKVLVTGGTGFVGRHLVDALVERGYQVRCLVRETSDVRHLAKLGVELVYGDIADKETLIKAVKDATIIIHLAALIHSNDKLLLEKINVSGTENLLKAATENGDKLARFILVTSAGVSGPIESNEPLNEESICKPITLYKQSKHRAEIIANEYYERYKLPLVVIRPPMIYGPGDHHSDFMPLIKLVSKGIIPKFPSSSPINLVYVKNLIMALILCVKDQRAIGNTYIVTDGRPYTLNEVISCIADTLGVVGPRIIVPNFVLRIYSAMTGSLVWAAKRVRYSCQKMTTELNYKPTYDLQQGLEQTVKWGVMQGQLKSKAHTVTSGEAVKMALSQNRGIGCAYDYVIRGRQISKILAFYSQMENETVKTMLLVESKMKFCPPWEVALLCDRLGIQLHMLEEEKLSSISNRYDLSICVAENLVFKELEQIAAKLKKLSRWTTIIVHNGDNTKFHIGGWNGITARQVTFLRPRYWGYLDVFPLPANIQVFRGKNISTGMNKLLSLTGNLLVRFWPVTEDKIPPPVKKRMAHMIFGMY